MVLPIFTTGPWWQWEGGLAVGLSGIVYVYLGIGLADDFGRGRDFAQVGDLKQTQTLPATYTPIGGGRVQPPAISALWTPGDDVHPIPFILTVMETLF